MADFFISYTSADREWAEWIAYVLEEERYSVILQAWDFRPGSNFVLEMQQAAKKAARTVMVLSPDYMKSQFASPEWSAAFARDPQGLERKLVPVVVRHCTPEGLLGQIVHISLLDLPQDAAKAELLAGVKADRAKPTSRPAFPGGGSPPQTPSVSPSSVTEAKPYMPRVKRALSDIEKRRFIKDGFNQIKNYFEDALSQLKRQTNGLDYDFQQISAVEFTAEMFVLGKSINACRIQSGGDVLSRDGITYAEGRGTMMTGGANEILSVNDNDGDAVFSSMMGGFMSGREEALFDLKKMSPVQASELLWRRFVSRLSEKG